MRVRSKSAIGMPHPSLPHALRAYQTRPSDLCENTTA
jgi:hypothetical protein